MKTRRHLACLLLALLLILSLAPAAFAEAFFPGKEGNISGDYDSTVFLAGSSPTSSADIRGILFAAGNTVTTNGSSEYAFLAGNTVTLTGTVSRDAFVGGNSVSFTGNCERDLAAAGNLVDIRGTVGRDLAAGGKNIVIAGDIGGNVVLAAEEITVADDAKIGGTLRYNSSAKITAPADLLARAEVYEDQRADQESDSSAPAPAEEARSSSPLSGLKSKVFGYIGLLLIAYALLWLTPLWEKLDKDYTGKPFGTFASTFGIGFAVLAALPIAALLLMLTGLGLRPAFVLLLIYAAILIAAPVFLAFFLGSLIWRKAVKKARNYWIELAVGLLVWRVLSVIPGLSVITSLVAGPLALGIFTRMLGKKTTTPPTAVPAPIDHVAEPAAPAAVSAEPEAPALPEQDSAEAE